MKFKLINLLVSLVVVASLGACGGGGGASPPVNTPTEIPVPTLIQGFYSGALNGKEVTSLVTPGLDFFILHFNTANNPDIYSGKFSLGLNGLAVSSTEGLFANMSGNLRSGTATFTNGSLQAYSGSLKLASQLAIDFTVSAPASGIYQLTQQAALSDLHGTWQGVWSDGAATAGTTLAPYSISISDAGEMTLPGINLVNSCSLTASLQPVPGSNIFTVVMTVPVLTGCVRTVGKQNGVVLNGAAVIYKSPIAGKTNRLELVVVDLDGSGLSFRGDR